MKTPENTRSPGGSPSASAGGRKPLGSQCPAADYDAWEEDQQILEASRVLRAHRLEVDTSPDKQHEDIDPPASRDRVSRFAIWLSAVQFLSLATLTCGGALLTWSVIASRDDLWTLGWPIAIAGQIVLLVTLVAEIDHVRRLHRSAWSHASAKPHGTHARLETTPSPSPALQAGRHSANRPARSARPWS